ncbi:NUDIX hydrolase [Actinoplanes regularis]|uniref:NUDIX hydrolase n=1 Tax=Actinoplanes regularis TaxID=52697 RepID=UPI000B78DF2D|nr:NUDIX domain-containing protein [Actinoplanes regularis]GIE90893.1 NUDIX hydrolase [Actinoplanes regularis]
MPKTDYLNDPAAPRANSLVVAVAVVLRDSEGRILLIQRADNGLWALPGGAQDLGESLHDAAKREVKEETGLCVEIESIVGIYSDPNHVIAYDDGEVRQEFSICLRGSVIGGELKPSVESTQVCWFTSGELDDIEIHPSMRIRIKHGLESRQPYIG